MIFVRFHTPSGEQYYFVGKDYETIIENTHNGKSWGDTKFSNNQTIEQETVTRLQFTSYNQAINTIESGVEISLIGIR